MSNHYLVLYYLKVFSIRSLVSYFVFVNNIDSLFPTLVSHSSIFVLFILILFPNFSELWRKENSLQHNLTSLKEELAKADQALRSMAGKVSFLFVQIRLYGFRRYWYSDLEQYYRRTFEAQLLPKFLSF